MGRLTTVVSSIAEVCSNEGVTVTFQTLGETFNSLGIKTTAGTTFSGSRGTAKIVNDTYKDLAAAGNLIAASKVANTYTNKDGGYSWK